jgi:hypothetical protein
MKKSANWIRGAGAVWGMLASVLLGWCLWLAAQAQEARAILAAGLAWTSSAASEGTVWTELRAPAGWVKRGPRPDSSPDQVMITTIRPLPTLVPWSTRRCTLSIRLSGGRVKRWSYAEVEAGPLGSPTVDLERGDLMRDERGSESLFEWREPALN